MKHFSLLYASLMALALVVMWCCTQPGTTADKSAPTERTATGVRYGDSIPTDRALREESLWLTKRDSLIALIKPRNAPDTAFLAKSFLIHKQDLTGMLNALKDSTRFGRDSIWASLGIRNNEITLIFHDFDRQRGVEVYFDFSKPCPPGICE